MITTVDILASLLWWLVMLAAVMLANRDLPAMEKRWLQLAVLLRALSTLAFTVALFTVFAGQSDALFYHRVGKWIATTLDTDSYTWLQQVILLILQVESARLPFSIIGIGTSTGTMLGLTGLLHWIFGSGLLLVSSVYASFAMVGTVLLYRTARRWFPQVQVWHLAIATMMVPTVLFWTGGILKEALTMGGLGMTLWGAHGLVIRVRPVAALVTLGGGLLMVYLSKPFFLVALVAALAAWLSSSLVRRTGARFTPLQLMLVGAAAVGAVFVLGEFSGRFSVSTLIEQTARLQELGRNNVGGSTFVLVENSSRSLTGQLAYSPLALFTALYRPLLFEARSAPMLVNALESTAFAVLTVVALRAAAVRGALSRALASPWLQFCVVFVLLSAVGIGLATHNLGTLSRYRVPFVPVWMMSLMAIHATGMAVRRSRMSPVARSSGRARSGGRRPILQPLAKVD